MKKIAKIIALVLVITTVLALFTGCGGPSPQELAGTYVGSYEYNGNLISVAVVINEEGQYASATVKNGQVSSSETGDYEVKGNKVKLYDSSAATYHGICTVYKYKNGTLENNGHKLVKE